MSETGCASWNGGPRTAPGQRDPEDGVGLLRGGARPPLAALIDYIDTYRERFGVEPICRVLREHGLQIAPNTYRAAKTRQPSARARRDAVVLERIRAVHSDRKIGRRLYGVRKVHAQLRREGGVAGRPVSRRQVERLMPAEGLQGVRRGRVFCATRPDPTATRSPDLVQRDFAAPAPNRLWLVDFTYVTPGRAWRSPPSSTTRSAAASSAGAPPRRCRPSCRWMPSRWRCGP